MSDPTRYNKTVALALWSATVATVGGYLTWAVILWDWAHQHANPQSFRFTFVLSFIIFFAVHLPRRDNEE